MKSSVPVVLPVCSGVGTKNEGSRGTGKLGGPLPRDWRSLGGLPGEAAEEWRTLGALGEMV